MSLGNLGSHWWVILIIVVLLFGAPKLPALAKSMGQSMRIFKNEIKTNKDEDAAKTAADPVAEPVVRPEPTVRSDSAARTDTDNPSARP